MECKCMHCEIEFDNAWCYKTSICKQCMIGFKNNTVCKKCPKCNGALIKKTTGVRDQDYCYVCQGECKDQITQGSEWKKK